VPSAARSNFSLLADQLALSRGGQVILDRVDLAVGPRTRLGIVGPNGVGKTTLLRILGGLQDPDHGHVARTPAALRVAYLDQEQGRGPATVRAFLERRSGVAAAVAGFDAAGEAVAAGRPGADDAYAAALDTYLEVGCADFDARLGTVGADLGLAPGILDEPIDTLSGGERARAALASLLLVRADVLLLDEPTNDLDFDGLDRLEQYLTSLPGGVVVVSHDRAFLERTVTSVGELDEHTHRAQVYAGGWNAYREARGTARRHAEDDYATYRSERDRLEGRARRQREWATQGVARARRDVDERDKYRRHFRIATSERLASKARATERSLERLDPVAKPWEGWDLRFDVAPAGRSGAVVSRLAAAVVERGPFRLGPIDLEIAWADRVALVGANGAGKTTLLHALLGHVPLEAGERWQGPSVVVGELEQHRGALLGATSVLDAIQAATGVTVTEARSQLAKFGLGADHVARPPEDLSPGERTRAALAEFALRGVNCLVLDEPSNHLDLPAVEELEAALDRYEGTLILVTHDRAVLESVRLTRVVRVDGGRIIGDEAARSSRPRRR
jgi:ATPase subunit of ABC transporter with duplicated ATPase domains